MKRPLFILLNLLVLSLMGCSSVSQIQLYNGPVLSASEEGMIVLPEEFELIELNGQAISDNRLRFRSGNMDVRLPSGQHTAVLQYKAFWQIDDDDHDTVTSGPITFKFSLNQSESFSIKTPQIKSHDQAVAFSKNPNIQMVSARQTIPGSHTPKDNALVLIPDKTHTATRYPNLEQLKFWWNRATYYEQNEFLTWQKKASANPN